MKKIFAKDQKNRISLKQQELNRFVLKQISSDSNFSKILKWNALYKLIIMTEKGFKTRISNRCVKTINKKTFNKMSNFSRTVFIKLVKSGQLSGFRKSSW